MPFFQQYQSSRLYVPTTTGDSGWLAYQLPTGVATPPTFELQAALTGASGSFLFAASPPDLSTPAALETFLTAIDNVLAPPTLLPRGMIWLAVPSNPLQSNVALLGLDDGSSVRTGLVAPIVQWQGIVMLSIQVNAGTTIGCTDTALTLGGPGQLNAVTWGGTSYPQYTTQIPSATIPCTGPMRGCLQFQNFIQRQSLYDNLNWGFQFLFPAPAAPVRKATAAWLPLAAATTTDALDQLGFDVTIDPSDPLGLVIDRTALAFTGSNWDGAKTKLVSGYRTAFGAPVNLVPVADASVGASNVARLVFHAGPPIDAGGETFQAAPAGDFVLQIDGATTGASCDLMCGLQGTEYIGFQPVTDSYAGDRIRFTPRQAAYAARFPFPPASPVGPPVSPNAPLLDSTYLTSWASVLRAPQATGSIPYVAQPKGASLYGRDALIHGSSSGGGKKNGNGNGGFPTLFGPMDPSVVLPTGAFPMAPYAGFTPGDGAETMSWQQTERFEREVLGPQRRMQIGGAQTARSKAAALAPDPRVTSDPTPFTTTTPSGLLVTLKGGTWQKALLGQNTPPSNAPPPPPDHPYRQMYFCNPNPPLQQALQTAQLFQVIANATNLGALADSGFGVCGAGAAFYNRMNVGDWDIAADVGQNNRYDDYTNVVIIKGRKGPLYDATSAATRAASLVVNPDQWTQKDEFAAPSDLQTVNGRQVPGPPDPTELVILSGWLQRYFDAAAQQSDTDYFATFNRIAADPNWTGILILRARIAKIPDDLAGIMGGISRDRFFAHHMAIEISPVENDPAKSDIELSSPSSIFGLIYYVDPSFTPPPAGQAAQPIPPAAGSTYDFRVLTLKVLFQNTAVQRFQSWAQLTLNTFFGMPVTRMGGDGANPFNTVVLAGAYQNNNGKPLYTLSSQADTTFFFDGNNIVRKIEIRSAAMSTLNPGTQATNPTVISWFGLTGLIDFYVTWQSFDPGDGQPVEYRPFDVFSFGSDEQRPPAGTPPTRIDGDIGKGLAFTNLGVQMSFPVDQPANRTLVFAADQIRFDVTRSTPRVGSLFQNFALQVQGLMQGTAQASTTSSGFLAVIPDVMFSGVDGGEWTGIRYALNLGTPGALAGNVGLTSQLLTAWSPASKGVANYRAAVGIQLPGTGGGAKLISLQNVLKLSIGQIRLARDDSKSSFLLMLTEIALRFLGLLKLPPNGSTLFYLFGNPQSQGKPSGLGWYAMFKSDSGAKQASPRVLP